MPQASYWRGANTIYDDTGTTDKYITLCDWRMILYWLSSSNNTALLFHENNKFDIVKKKNSIQRNIFSLSSEPSYL